MDTCERKIINVFLRARFETCPYFEIICENPCPSVAKY
jgi:hypothetical protein